MKKYGESRALILVWYVASRADGRGCTVYMLTKLCNLG